MAIVTPVIGCDYGPELDGDAADVVDQQLDAESDDLEQDAGAAAAVDHAAMQVLTDIDDPSALALNAFSRRSVLLTDTLNEGEVVLLNSYVEGYLGCDGNGAVTASKTLGNPDGRIWRVHLVDLDNDGDDEMQFELANATGYTNTYLKMDNLGILHCGSITGIGDAAAWNWGNWYGHTGTVYRAISRSLVSYKHGECIHASSLGGHGGVCNHHISTSFNMEILDTTLL